MTILSLDWNKGQDGLGSSGLRPGMVVELSDDLGCHYPSMVLIGDYTHEIDLQIFNRHVKRWAWLIQTYQAQWLADIQRKHAKGRAE